MPDFAGKVALVTGTSGIGRATAINLALSGASVIALGIDLASNAALTAETVGVIVQHADVSVPADVARAILRWKSVLAHWTSSSMPQPFTLMAMPLRPLLNSLPNALRSMSAQSI